jgi:hypothetical protein
VAVDVAATDNVAVNKVDLYANGTLVASDVTSPYSFTWDTSSYADGAATLVAKPSDGAGNVGTSASVSVTVANDTVPPTVTITNPPNGSTVSGSVVISVSASDNQRVSKISLSINGQEVAIAMGATLSSTWSANGKGKNRSGTYTIDARAWDPAGNQGSTSITVKR